MNKRVGDVDIVMRNRKTGVREVIGHIDRERALELIQKAAPTVEEIGYQLLVPSEERHGSAA